METLEEKQNYLRSEIIDKQYDGEAFTKFLSKITNKEDLDLDEISPEIIKSAVAQFQAKSEEEKTNPPKEGAKNPEEGLNENLIENKDNNNHEEDFNYIPPLSETPTKIDLSKPVFGNYCEIIKCEKEEAKQFTDQDDLFIIVSSPESVKKGFFSKKYYQYKVQIKDSLEPPVIRKLDDFDFLNRILIDLFPGCLTPPIAPSHLNLKEDSIKKVNYLNRFMNSLAENKLFRSTAIFTDFLTMDQEEFNQKRKNTYEKMPKPKNMNHFTTLDGQIQLYITEKKEEKAKNLRAEIIKINNDYKRLGGLFDTLMKQFDEISKTFNEISKSFMDLSKAYADDNIMKKDMNWFKDFFSKWSEGYKEQKDFFMTDIKYFFKYMSKELDLVLPMHDSYKISKEEYEERFRAYSKAVQKLEKDEVRVVISKRSYSYYLKKLLEEFELLTERHKRRLAKQFIVLSEKRDKFTKDYICFNELLNFTIDKTEIQIPELKKEEEEKEPIIKENTEGEIVESP